MTYPYICGAPLCRTEVKGIYCPEHRSAWEAERESSRVERSDRMRELWSTRREEMLAAIAAGKSPATEGS